MKESRLCTKEIVQLDGQHLPQCMVGLLSVDQAERNFLTCQTYHLGIYKVCETCPLECPKNPNKRTPLQDIVSALSGIFGIDSSKQKEINGAINRLNKPEFQEVYSCLERASSVIKDAMDNKAGANEVARKVLEIESANLKKAFDGLITDGKISAEEASLLKSEVNSSNNIQKLKSMLESLKKNQ